MSISKDSKAYQQWLELKKRIEASTPLPPIEKAEEKRKRIKRLESNFVSWCNYYFPHIIKSPFGYFHREAAPAVIGNPNAFAVLEWPREHAKSLFVNPLLIAYLYYRNEIKSLVLVSQTESKACKLLGDIQAAFEANQRLIHDYGEQKALGSWADGEFRTLKGVGFYAYGAGQSARGIRDGAERPNFCFVDDIDTNQRCKNEELVEDTLNWLRSDIFGACSIKQCRYIIAGNRIHKKSILAKLVGNVEDADPINEAITHYSRVYAFEDENRQKSDHLNGQPAWHENYTAQHLLNRFNLLGYRSTRQEFFHEQVTSGKVFRAEDIQWVTPLPYHKYEELITYCDPSYKDAKKNDYKAIVLLGRIGQHIHILEAWVRQATIKSMVAVHYEIGQRLYSKDIPCRHFMESNFIQDAHLNEYDLHGHNIGWTLHIRGDNRKKDDKYSRIENLSPLFERGLIGFSEAYRKSSDMQTLVQQFLSFPTGHDDGPDAVEGAIYKLRKKAATKKHIEPRLGKVQTKSTRRL